MRERRWTWALIVVGVMLIAWEYRKAATLESLDYPSIPLLLGGLLAGYGLGRLPLGKK